MDEKSLQILEFPRVRDILAGHTSFEAGHELAQQLMPLTDFEEVSQLLKLSEEAIYLMAVDREFSIGDAHDIRDMVNMAALGKLLEPQVLIEVQQTLSVMRQVRNSLAQAAGDVPLLWEIAKDIKPLHDLEKHITHCISPAGEVLDRASTKLHSVRRRLRDTRQSLRQRLEAIIREPGVQRVVQEPIITEREGRYVIPVKNDMRRDIEGITHDVSNTGATVFVEPWAAIELGNAVKELVTEERYEVEKILQELSQTIGINNPEIQVSISRLAELDLALAKAKYARSVNASCPELVKNETGKGGVEASSYVNLVDARHPLLGKKAVPLSVEIGHEYTTLVITGPNTGGKTVALKTIGLMSLMTQAGIPIPAAPQTRLPVFDSVFADIGDEQSIEQTLSSFSWHISNIVRILEHATSRSMVLLDELGTATDPAEGSALARSILAYFLSKRVVTVATTHYSDLKVFAHQTDGMENASFDFDPETLAPTYRITLGIPGGSNALATAARLGVPADIIDNALSMLSRGELDLNNTLSDIMAEKQKIAETRLQIEKDGIEARKKNKELEQKLAEVRETERYILQEAKDKIVREAADLHREIRKAGSDLRRQKSAEAAEAARKTLAETRARLESEEWTARSMPAVDDDVIRKGDLVYLEGIDLRGTVTAVYEDNGEVQVQAGQLNLRVRLDSARKIGKESVPRSRINQQPVSVPLMPRVRGELDLRGKRADEVEPELDLYLNNAALSNRNEVIIIHGVATGTVKNIVAGMLSSHPLVKGFRPGVRGEGGEGVTVVTL